MFETRQILRDRYQLQDKLSNKLSPQTWLADDLQTQQPVVVKLLAFSDRVHWDDLKLFEREAKVLKHLNHPRIPQYCDYFHLDDHYLWFGLVQHYIPGVTLKDWMAVGKTCNEGKARKVAIDVLDILIYLQSLNPPVLHRDIKPSNLIRGDDGNIYLIDFGAVQDRAAVEGATFTVVGTYGYTPLEQFGGRSNLSSDLYALGATLIHLVTGVTPADLPQYDGRLQFAHLVDLNPGFVRWLTRLVEPNADQRFPNARTALDALHENKKASSAIACTPPTSRRIHLEKAPTRLQITIPPRPFNTMDQLKLVAIVLLLIIEIWGIVVVQFSALIFLVCGLALAAYWILPTFRTTTITFDSQTFEIRWKVGRRKVAIKQVKRGRTAEIDSVFRGEIQGYKKAFPNVTIASGVRELAFTTFDPPLTPKECDWLVKEIKHWLGL
jgi:serine/threonine protein kinase